VEFPGENLEDCLSQNIEAVRFEPDDLLVIEFGDCGGSFLFK